MVDEKEKKIIRKQRIYFNNFYFFTEHYLDDDASYMMIQRGRECKITTFFGFTLLLVRWCSGRQTPVQACREDDKLRVGDFVLSRDVAGR